MCRCCSIQSSPIPSLCKGSIFSDTGLTTAETDFLELLAASAIVHEILGTFLKWHPRARDCILENMERTTRGQIKPVRRVGHHSHILVVKNSGTDQAVCASALSWWIDQSWFRTLSWRFWWDWSFRRADLQAVSLVNLSDHKKEYWLTIPWY